MDTMTYVTMAAMSLLIVGSLCLFRKHVKVVSYDLDDTTKSAHEIALLLRSARSLNRALTIYVCGIGAVLLSLVWVPVLTQKPVQSYLPILPIQTNYTLKIQKT